MPSKPGQYRPAHQRPRVVQRRDADQRRGSARERGYDTNWDKAALAFKDEHPLCLGCEAIGRVVLCTVVDHTIPHRGDRDLFWNTSNWQPCCAWHHDTIKKRLELLYDAGSIGADQLALDSAKAKALILEMGA